MNRRGFLKSLGIAAAALTLELQASPPQRRVSQLGFVEHKEATITDACLDAVSEWYSPKVVDQIFAANPFASRLKANSL